MSSPPSEATGQVVARPDKAHASTSGGVTLFDALRAQHGEVGEASDIFRADPWTVQKEYMQQKREAVVLQRVLSRTGVDPVTDAAQLGALRTPRFSSGGATGPAAHHATPRQAHAAVGAGTGVQQQATPSSAKQQPSPRPPTARLQPTSPQPPAPPPPPSQQLTPPSRPVSAQAPPRAGQEQEQEQQRVAPPHLLPPLRENSEGPLAQQAQEAQQAQHHDKEQQQHQPLDLGPVLPSPGPSGSQQPSVQLLSASQEAPTGELFVVGDRHSRSMRHQLSQAEIQDILAQVSTSNWDNIASESRDSPSPRYSRFTRMRSFTNPQEPTGAVEGVLSRQPSMGMRRQPSMAQRGQVRRQVSQLQLQAQMQRRLSQLRLESDGGEGNGHDTTGNNPAESSTTVHTARGPAATDAGVARTDAVDGEGDAPSGRLVTEQPDGWRGARTSEGQSIVLEGTKAAVTAHGSSDGTSANHAGADTDHHAEARQGTAEHTHGGEHASDVPPRVMLVEVMPMLDTGGDDEDKAKVAPAAAAAAAPVTDLSGASVTAGPDEAPASPAGGGTDDKAQLERSGTAATYDGVGDLSQYHPVRQWCIQLCSNPDFELAVVVVIFGNLVSLALYRPLEPESSSWNHALFIVEATFNGIFTVEMLLRIISLGGVFSYLKHPWNQFDCLMVLAGYTAFIPVNSSDTAGVRALRAMRALRPLRTITRFESLRAIVVCFLEAVPLLMSVVGLMLMFMFMFAVVGTELFNNVFHWKCRSDITGEWENDGDDVDMFGCDGWRHCPANFTCTYSKGNDAINVAGYDNLGLSLLSVFQCLTLTGWSFLMYRTMDNTSPFAVIYFLTLVLIGAYILMNLFVAVLKTKFAKAQTTFQARKATMRGKVRQNSVVMLFGNVTSKVSAYSAKRSQMSTMNSIMSEKMSQQSRGMSVSDRSDRDRDSLGRRDSPVQGGAAAKVTVAGAVATDAKRAEEEAVAQRLIYGSPAPAAPLPPLSSPTAAHGPAIAFSRGGARPIGEAAEDKEMGAAGGAPAAAADGDDDDAALQQKRVLHSLLSSLAPPEAVQVIDEETAPKHTYVPKAAPAGATGGLKKATEAPGVEPSPLSKDLSRKEAASAGRRGAGVSFIGGRAGKQTPAAAASGYFGPPGDGALGAAANLDVAMMIMSVQEFDEFVADQPWARRTRLRAQFRTRKLVESPWFNNMFLLAILVNTVLLAMVYDTMSAAYEQSLNLANMALTGLFTVEVVLKLFGLGFWDYIKDGFNIFDFCVVTISLVEIFLTSLGVSALRSLRALRILRAFRVFRLFKLFKYLSSLRKIGAVLLSSFKSFAAIGGLVILFWVDFSIVGLHVFGGLTLGLFPYPNYDTFLNSLVATFNILTLENYQNTMWDIVRASNYGAVFFYMIWIVIGKYIFLTLFLAVMLEAFESKFDNTSSASSKASFMSKVRSALSSVKSSAISARSSRSNSTSTATTGSKPLWKGLFGGGAKVAPSPPSVTAAEKPGQEAMVRRSDSALDSAPSAGPDTPGTIQTTPQSAGKGPVGEGVALPRNDDSREQQRWQAWTWRQQAGHHQLQLLQPADAVLCRACYEHCALGSYGGVWCRQQAGLRAAAPDDLLSTAPPAFGDDSPAAQQQLLQQQLEQQQLDHHHYHQHHHHPQASERCSISEPCLVHEPHQHSKTQHSEAQPAGPAIAASRPSCSDPACVCPCKLHNAAACSGGSLSRLGGSFGRPELQNQEATGSADDIICWSLADDWTETDLLPAPEQQQQKQQQQDAALRRPPGPVAEGTTTGAADTHTVLPSKAGGTGGGSPAKAGASASPYTMKLSPRTKPLDRVLAADGATAGPAAAQQTDQAGNRRPQATALASEASLLYGQPRRPQHAAGAARPVQGRRGVEPPAAGQAPAAESAGGTVAAADIGNTPLVVAPSPDPRAAAPPQQAPSTLSPDATSFADVSPSPPLIGPAPSSRRASTRMMMSPSLGLQSRTASGDAGSMSDAILRSHSRAPSSRMTAISPTLGADTAGGSAAGSRSPTVQGFYSGAEGGSAEGSVHQGVIYSETGRSRSRRASSRMAQLTVPAAVDHGTDSLDEHMGAALAAARASRASAAGAEELQFAAGGGQLAARGSRFSLSMGTDLALPVATAARRGSRSVSALGLHGGEDGSILGGAPGQGFGSSSSSNLVLPSSSEGKPLTRGTSRGSYGLEVSPSGRSFSEAQVRLHAVAPHDLGERPHSTLVPAAASPTWPSAPSPTNGRRSSYQINGNGSGGAALDGRPASVPALPTAAIRPASAAGSKLPLWLREGLEEGEEEEEEEGNHSDERTWQGNPAQRQDCVHAVPHAPATPPAAAGVRPLTLRLLAPPTDQPHSAAGGLQQREDAGPSPPLSPSITGLFADRDPSTSGWMPTSFPVGLDPVGFRTSLTGALSAYASLAPDPDHSVRSAASSHKGSGSCPVLQPGGQLSNGGDAKPAASPDLQSSGDIDSASRDGGVRAVSSAAMGAEGGSATSATPRSGELRLSYAQTHGYGNRTTSASDDAGTAGQYGRGSLDLLLATTASADAAAASKPGGDVAVTGRAAGKTTTRQALFAEVPLLEDGAGDRDQGPRHDYKHSAACSKDDDAGAGGSHGGGAAGESPSKTPEPADGTAEDEEEKEAERKRRHAHATIPLQGKSFWCIDEHNRFRRWLYRLVGSKKFEYLLFAIIILNCAAMTLERPTLDSGSPMGRALFWSGVAFTAIFTVEAIMKVTAWTFVLYIKQVTNAVDFVIVITSLLELSLTGVDLDIVKALRVLRVLKPLRVLTRSAGMRLVFKSVVMSFGAMLHVSVVCILFFLIFAILGVQLFMGRFYSCNDITVAGKAECVGTFVDVLTNTTLDRTWTNQFPNFDNVGDALLVCFLTATLNGYTETMVAAMAAPEEMGVQPVPNSNPGAFFWFVGFIMVFAFTLLNLYIGVIFSQFSKIRNLSTTGSAFLTGEQQEWAELSRLVFKLKPPEKSQLPRGKWRRRAFHMVHTKGFELFIMLVILVNVTVMASGYYDEPQWSLHLKQILNNVFLAIYVLEAAVKIYALSWRGYFKDPWNRFDFALVVVGVLDLALSMLKLNFLRVLRIIRAQRIFRMIRLAKNSKGLKSLFATLVASLPAFGNVGSLIGLLLFMYAYLGVMLFGKLAWNTGINSQANYSNFGQAILTLVRVATGDNWSDIWKDSMVTPPDCDRSLGTCGSWVAIPYYLTFILLTSVVMLNLFTAVIIENFELQHKQEEWRLGPQHLENFVTLWSEYDDGTATIKPKDLEELLLRLEPPLGLGEFADSKDVLRFVYDLDIPLIGGRVPFHKTAFELVKRCSQANIPDGKLKDQIDKLVEQFFKDLQHDETMNFSVAVSVAKIQRLWRTRLRANKLRRRKEWRYNRGMGVPGFDDLVAMRGAVPSRLEEYRAEARAAAAAAGKPYVADPWQVNLHLLDPSGTLTVLAPTTTAAAQTGSLMSLFQRGARAVGGIRGFMQHLQKSVKSRPNEKGRNHRASDSGGESAAASRVASAADGTADSGDSNARHQAAAAAGGTNARLLRSTTRGADSASTSQVQRAGTGLSAADSSMSGTTLLGAPVRFPSETSRVKEGMADVDRILGTSYHPSTKQHRALMSYAFAAATATSGNPVESSVGDGNRKGHRSSNSGVPSSPRKARS